MKVDPQLPDEAKPGKNSKFDAKNGAAQRATMTTINLTFYLIILSRLAVRNAKNPAFPYFSRQVRSICNFCHF
jgi:hypothetical protein